MTILAAFSEEDIAFFAPLMAQALSKARPEEVVTFYETHYLSATRRAVTSGGLFVQGDVLHLILANYWAPIDDYRRQLCRLGHTGRPAHADELTD